jgi:hypothetical protein
MVEDVVAKFVAHDRLHFLRRGAVEEIVVQADPDGRPQAADIG